MKHSRFLSLFLALSMLIGMTGLFALPVMAETDGISEVEAAEPQPSANLPIWKGEVDTKWYDETEFTLTTPEQLAGLAQLVNEGKTFAGVTITLGADLNLGNVDWGSIGASLETPFSGTLDGAGHTIFGLAKSPLFKYIDGATIKNLTLTGRVTQTFELSSSPLAAKADNSTILSCVNYATLTQTHAPGGSINIYGGGIVGYAKNTNLTSCENHGKITVYNSSTGGKANAFAGGIVGNFTADTSCANPTGVVLDACVNYGNVSVRANNGQSHARAGGIAGTTKGADATIRSTIQNSLNYGTLSLITAKAATALGGIIGYIDSYTTAQDCVNKGEMNLSALDPTSDKNLVTAGGIVGRHDAINGSMVSRCVNMGAIDVSAHKGTSYVGGILGELNANSADVENNYEHCANYGILKSTYVAGGLLAITTYGNNDVYFKYCINYGDVTVVNTGARDVYAGGLGGILDDNGSTKFEMHYCANYGNVTVEEAVGTATLSYAGGLAGKTMDSFLLQYCYTSGKVSGADYCGGFVGFWGPSTNIKQSVSDCVVEGREYAGPLAGYTRPYYAKGNMSNCVFTGTVSAEHIGTFIYPDALYSKEKVTKGTIKITIPADALAIKTIKTVTVLGKDIGDAYTYNPETRVLTLDTALSKQGTIEVVYETDQEYTLNCPNTFVWSQTEDKDAAFTALQKATHQSSNLNKAFIAPAWYKDIEGNPIMLHQFGFGIDGASVRLDNSLALNLYALVDDNANDTVTYTVLVNGVEMLATEQVEIEGKVFNRYILSDILATDLDKQYIIEVKVSDTKNASYPITSQIMTYSILDYMERKYDTDTTGEKQQLNDLIVAMAQYGAAAEQSKDMSAAWADLFFENTGATPLDLDAAYEALEKTQQDMTVANQSILSMSLKLEENITALFKVTADVKSAKVTMYGEITEIKDINGEFSFSGIKPTSLNTVVTIVTYNEAGEVLDETPWSVSTFILSGMEIWSAAYQDLAKALAVYMDKAYAYASK